MKSLFSFILALFSIAIATTSAQAPIQEGRFVYAVTTLETDNPQLNQVFAGATLTVEAKGQTYRTINTMMGSQFTIEMVKSADLNTNLIYLNMMGQKVATQVPADEFDKKWKNENDNTIITYNREDTKMINGFNCFAAKIETLKEDGSVAELNVYLTEEIQLPNHLSSNMPEKLQGFPLEFTGTQNGATITFTLQSYSNEFSEWPNYPLEGYPVLPYDQFMNKIGKQMGL